MTHDGHSDDRYLGLLLQPRRPFVSSQIFVILVMIMFPSARCLFFALSKIEHRQEKLEKMKHLLEVRESISVSGLTTALGATGEMQGTSSAHQLAR